uniref:Uncharacterized protein n=1 Tax=Manihot esculenta TaxID=3983 RepID=A0A251M3W0_MANES
MMMFSCQPFSSSSYADLSHDAFQYLICSFLVPSDLAFNFGTLTVHRGVGVWPMWMNSLKSFMTTNFHE